jgi:glycosyltransferase involved in cell wall biosynthesis
MKMYLPRLATYRERLLADGVDIIHVTTPGPIGLAALRLARALEVPLVGTFHTDLAAYAALLSGWSGLGTVMRAYLRWLYGRCDRVLVPSEATRQLLLEAGTSAAARLDIWTRGVDTDAFTPSRRWGVSDQRPAILYVGRVSREKGLDVLCGLQRSLGLLGLRYRLIIAGAGPMVPELRSRLDDAVFTGTLNRDDVATAFASADLLLFPSRTDTAGNVVLEAQASALPVIVSDAGGPSENMVHGQTGFIVSGVGPDAWAWWLVPLLRDRQLRLRLGANARRYALSRSWASSLEPLYQTYQDLLEERQARTSQMVSVVHP